MTGPRPACGSGVALALAAAAAVVLTGRLVEVSPSAAVIALIATMALLIAVHMPIAFAVGIACVVYVVLRGELPLIVVPHRMIGGMDSFLLLAMPLFVLAGDLMNTGGITERLVGFARALVGHIRGGLGMTTVVSEYLFSGISGSSAADVSAVGSLLIPAMTRAGYRPELAVSIVAAASAMGVLVPPCLMMVVLASLTDLSVAALFMAGFLPAAAMALLLMGLIYVQARRENLPREPRPSAREVLRACARGTLPLIAPVIILGGILGGIVTPTEAAVLAVLYALLLGLVIYREIRLRDLMPLLINTASLTGMVMLLVGTASVLSWIFAAQGIPRMIAGVLLGLSIGPVPRAAGDDPGVRAAGGHSRGRARDDHPGAGVLPDHRALRHRSAALRHPGGRGARPRPLHPALRRRLLHRLRARPHQRGERRAGLRALRGGAADRPGAGRVRAVDHPDRPAAHEALRGEPMLHTLRATPETCFWGFFDAALPPVLRVRSGDLVRIETLTHQAGDAPDLMMDAGVKAVYDAIPIATRGPGVHVMTGPIHVEGAEPGDTLEIRVLSMEPRLAYGTNIAAWWGHLYDDFGKERITIYRIDAAAGLARAAFAFDYTTTPRYEQPGIIVPPDAGARQPALAERRGTAATALRGGRASPRARRAS